MTLFAGGLLLLQIVRYPALPNLNIIRIEITLIGEPVGSGVPGALSPGRPTRVQPSPFLAWPQAVMAPQLKEQHPMHALRPSKIRAAAHRALALAALHADSSLRTRLARYNDHMAKARALENTGGAQ